MLEKLNANKNIIFIILGILLLPLLLILLNIILIYGNQIGTNARMIKEGICLK